MNIKRMHWSLESLQKLAQESLRDRKLIVVSNREPYIHRRSGGRIECQLPASGMAAALDPVMRACGGIWVAHGSGDADRETAGADGRLSVPPDNPRYTLRRVWLSKEQEQGYYYGLSNEGLWPLCHIVFRRPVFRPQDWESYRRVNATFAQAVLKEAGDSPSFVFVQDYHLALLPRMLRQSRSDLVIAQFWHIPWPNRETFRAFPWPEELLDGLLGNDLLGFHVRYHCQNFLDTVDRTIEARVDLEHSEITRGGRITAVRPFPISIDFAKKNAAAGEPSVDREMRRLRRKLGLEGKLLGLGVDRIDYTKGIPDRLRALDLFLERYPAYRNRVVFLQVGVPSRIRIGEYRRLDDEIDTLVEEINWKWSTASWKPITFLKQHLEPLQMTAVYRLASFCFVSSLHDGMNLVAKEFVGSRCDEQGVLILSKFTGAARELRDAVRVNPFDVGQCAEAILSALEMPEAQQRARMRKMRTIVAANNIYRWAGKILISMAGLSQFPVSQLDSPEKRDWIALQTTLPKTG